MSDVERDEDDREEAEGGRATHTPNLDQHGRTLPERHTIEAFLDEVADRVRTAPEGMSENDYDAWLVEVALCLLDPEAVVRAPGQRVLSRLVLIDDYLGVDTEAAQQELQGIGEEERPDRSPVQVQQRYVQPFYVAPAGGSFPLDMLRYDECYPVDEQEAYAIQNAMSPGGDALTGAIKLVRVGRSANPPDAARWASFGWRIVEKGGPRERDIRLERMSRPRTKKPATPTRYVSHRALTAEDWNRSYPVGTSVRYFPVQGDFDHIETWTRSEAWAVSGDPLVKVEGVRGGVLLSHLAVEQQIARSEP